MAGTAAQMKSKEGGAYGNAQLKRPSTEVPGALMAISNRKHRAAIVPPSSWPPRMTAEMAAGCVSEKHVEDFLEPVGTAYPEPCVLESATRKFWYREDLDRVMNLGVDAVPRLGEKFRAKMAEKTAARNAPHGAGVRRP
ncbi:hypothetical protein EME01_25250 [Sinorhizobium meliloti]|nr:hypothetical protein EME01_25250 [Sinorhizobium meliloti]CCM71361.1 hypothetical protein BN406_05079 [Sinorhizobium meliloti Rm41]